MSRELKLRIISALILGAVVLEVTWFGGRSFVILWAIASILILMETSRISTSSIAFGPRLVSFFVLVLVLAAWLLEEFSLSLTIYTFSLLVIAGWEFFLKRTPWASIGLVYAGLPFFTITELRGGADDSLLAVLVLFACVWGADIFAYLFGKTIGGPKLAPSISPNKTWSGFIGSQVGAIVCSVVIVIAAGYAPSFALLILVLALAVISQIGDLVESSFKRHFGVKDSGRIIPGHGGVLDRIDGLIFAGILFWIILAAIQYIGALNMTLPDVFLSRFVGGSL